MTEIDSHLILQTSRTNLILSFLGFGVMAEFEESLPKEGEQA